MTGLKENGYEDGDAWGRVGESGYEDFGWCSSMKKSRVHESMVNTKIGLPQQTNKMAYNIHSKQYNAERNNNNLKQKQ